MQNGILWLYSTDRKLKKLSGKLLKAWKSAQILSIIASVIIVYQHISNVFFEIDFHIQSFLLTAQIKDF